VTNPEKFTLCALYTKLINESPNFLADGVESSLINA
jgi:hypothetical protein